ncbi:hypothetical protein AXG53_16720 [Stenotrophomonas sp. KCTC 12332]|nr:hypothetical protein AXG53_16720 [Stenotrophomonas sp. KCTC 12332]
MSGMGTGGLALESELPAAMSAGDAALRAQLSPVEFDLFAQYGVRRTLQADELLFRRGDLGSSMFIIVSGTVSLDFGAGLAPKPMGSSDFFGELGLLIERHPRSCDARANCDSVLLEITHANFHRLIDQDPAMVVFFLRRTLSRVVSSEQRLIAQLSRRNHELESALGNLYSTNHELHHTRELVYSDDLTGLSNRRALTAYLKKSHRSGHRPRGLLLIDCDDFKGLNDSYGHLAGDHALQCFGRILASVAGKDDIACRLGGDEFCVLLMDADADGLQRTADFVLDAVRHLIAYPGATVGACSLSIGMVLIDEDHHWNDSYSRADKALYEAKRDGGNRAQWCREGFEGLEAFGVDHVQRD